MFVSVCVCVCLYVWVGGGDHPQFTWNSADRLVTVLEHWADSQCSVDICDILELPKR